MHDEGRPAGRQAGEVRNVRLLCLRYGFCLPEGRQVAVQGQERKCQMERQRLGFVQRQGAGELQEQQVLPPPNPGAAGAAALS